MRISRELRHKLRKTRRKVRDERQDSNANGRNVSPKVFKSKSKSGTKPVRPTDLTTMLESLESIMPYHDQYIDNPFSSPSPLTSPNDERLDPFGSRRLEKLYMQGGGTFRAVSRDRILEPQQSRDGDKYLRLGDDTPSTLFLVSYADFKLRVVLTLGLSVLLFLLELQLK
ncbi:unnamed protein product [Arctia plantaginis]|uniref:Uncharacterized protein n=1 Tax=Arctia plantaginis TaxID=874455 RepID=A0A8S0YVR2_ARCPL|nr:unnamed protein product [Arctia plantaginis]